MSVCCINEHSLMCLFNVQVIFSSLYQQAVPFTRDYSEIRSALGKLEEFNKTCITVALAGVDQLLCDEWGCSSHCQVSFFDYHFLYITFRVSRRRRDCIVATRICVSCLSLAAFPYYCMDLDLTLGMVGVPRSCARFCRFAISARVSLLWQHSAALIGNRCTWQHSGLCKMSVSALYSKMQWFLVSRLIDAGFLVSRLIVMILISWMNQVPAHPDFLEIITIESVSYCRLYSFFCL